MLGGAVALVLRKTVARIQVVQLKQAQVAGGLGQDRCSSDAVAAAITLHNGQLILIDVNALVAIDQCAIAGGQQCLHGSFHGTSCRLQDVDLVDLSHLSVSHSPGNAALADDRGQLIAPVRAKALGVIDPSDRMTGIQDHGRRAYRTCQRAAPCLVDSRHTMQIAGPGPGQTRVIVPAVSQL